LGLYLKDLGCDNLSLVNLSKGKEFNMIEKYKGKSNGTKRAWSYLEAGAT